HEKYLTLIDSIALLHQHQREIKTKTFEGESFDYVEVTLDDIKMANELAHEVLGRSLDELPPQTRNLLKQIQQMAMSECEKGQLSQSDYRFSRKQIRIFTGWSDSQLKNHCKRLEEMEYLLVHRGSRGHSIEYELLFTSTANDDQAQLMGLIDTEKLTKHPYDAQKSGQKGQKSPPSLAQVCPKSGLSLASENASKPLNTEPRSKKTKINGKTHSTRGNKHPIHRNRTTISTSAELA
ncbi:MAG: hypothetical protein L3J38_06460, partial [Thiomicrorhabdus sp.]|nr:hypothetical protein [Thiomicrorhabdus sp.]